MIMNAFLPAVQMSGEDMSWVYTGLNMPSSPYTNSTVSRIGIGVFQGRSHPIPSDMTWTNVSFVESYAFYGNYSITNISLPVATEISTHAFNGCVYLVSAYCPSVTSIGGSVFQGCASLISVYIPKVSIINTNAFSGCTKLSYIDCAQVIKVSLSAFLNCRLLKSVVGKIYVCSSSAFQGCSALSLFVTSNAGTSSTVSVFNSTTFRSCYNLLSIYLLNSYVMKLGATNAFNSTPISNYTTSTGGVNGSIYVPESLYSTYRTATNWTTFAARFVSLTDAQIAALDFS